MDNARVSYVDGIPKHRPCLKYASHLRRPTWHAKRIWMKVYCFLMVAAWRGRDAGPAEVLIVE